MSALKPPRWILQSLARRPRRARLERRVQLRPSAFDADQQAVYCKAGFRLADGKCVGHRRVRDRERQLRRRQVRQRRGRLAVRRQLPARVQRHAGDRLRGPQRVHERQRRLRPPDALPQHARSRTCSPCPEDHVGDGLVGCFDVNESKNAPDTRAPGIAIPAQHDRRRHRRRGRRREVRRLRPRLRGRPAARHLRAGLRHDLPRRRDEGHLHDERRGRQHRHGARSPSRSSSKTSGSRYRGGQRCGSRQRVRQVRRTALTLANFLLVQKQSAYTRSLCSPSARSSDITQAYLTYRIVPVDPSYRSPRRYRLTVPVARPARRRSVVAEPGRRPRPVLRARSGTHQAPCQTQHRRRREPVGVVEELRSASSRSRSRRSVLRSAASASAFASGVRSVYSRAAASPACAPVRRTTISTASSQKTVAQSARGNRPAPESVTGTREREHRPVTPARRADPIRPAIARRGESRASARAGTPAGGCPEKSRGGGYSDHARKPPRLLLLKSGPSRPSARAKSTARVEKKAAGATASPPMRHV